MRSVNYNLFLIFPGSLLSGLSVYFLLSYLLIPNRITLPLSIIISVLIFGLTKYYYVQKEENTTKKNNALPIDKRSVESNITNIGFIVIYIILLAVLVNSSSSATTPGLFINWEKITFIQVLDLTAAVAFTFFLPGYALVTILNKKYKLTLLLKLLLAYLFSILITGLEGYLSGSLGYAISNVSMFFIGSFVLIFLFSLQQFNALSRGFYHVSPPLYHQSLSKIWKSLRNNYSQFIVFSSLFALVILYTYYLNDGKIVIDQWYHHGRALLIGSGLFRDLGPSDLAIPPFFSSLLAAFFNLSGSPSVNAYVTISFLNIVPVFASYYFFTNWIPKDKQRAALLASTLFMLSSGFGWVYAINTAVASHHQVTFDVSSSLEIFSQASRKTFDIATPTTFINVGHPDVTTSLIIIALPAGFTLLGLIKEVKLFNLNNGDDNTSPRLKSRYFKLLTCIAIVTAISFLGILSHDEFYLFIIVASTAMVVLFRVLPINVNYSIFFVSFLSAISLVFLMDTFISPARFYTYRHILHIPLLTLCFLFVSFNWALYATFRKIRISHMFNTNRIKRRIKIITQQAILKRIFTLNFLNGFQIRFLKLTLATIIVLVIAYFYLFTLLVWNALSIDEVRSQIKEFSNVPWYLYPVKFGLTGLLGLAFVLSYLFKKFEKEIFIFGIIIIIALFAGPYYDEHRFGKYIMASMAAFAALLIYKIISSGLMRLDLKLRPLIIGLLLGTVVTVSGLSIFMYAGYVELFTGKSDWIEGGRRDFPTTSEIQLLNFLNNKIIHSKAYNIALPEKETTNERGFVTKIYGFSPTSRIKLLQSPLTLNASTLEGLYNLLDYTDVRYIILPKKDIIVDMEKEGITSSSNNNYNGNISNVIRFVLDNFPKTYEDQNYIVLEVLPLTPPSSQGSNVALIYKRDFQELLFPVSNESKILPTDSESFGFQTEDSGTKNNSNYDNNIVIKRIEVENKNLSSTAFSLTLGGNFSNNNSKSIILWSRPIQEIQQHNDLNSGKNNRTIINYIEGNFKIIDDFPIQNKSEKKNADSFGAGILWEHDNKKYHVSISDVGLELSQSPSKITLLSKEHEQVSNNNNGKKASSSILSQNEEIKRQKGIWYNLKILLLKNTIEIYVNDILRIKAPVRDYYSQPSSAEKNITDESVSRVGISSYYSKSEFQPIIVGRISELTEQSYPSYQKEKIYYKHYFPLSLLALSKIRYDTFLDGDMSAFSKKYVVLPFDLSPYQENETSKYLEFVNKGGNLIVMNSDNNFEGAFSKLLSIKPGNLTKFNTIETYNSGKKGEKKYNLDVSGISRNIEINPYSNLTVKSFYMNKDKGAKAQSVSPFGIEKNYGNGKIIFVNVAGYFDAILGKSFSVGNNAVSNENQYFATLSKVTRIIGIPDDNRYVKINSHPITLSSLAGIIGDLKIFSRQTIMINGSSLLLSESNINDKNPDSYNLTARVVSVSTTPLQNISLANHSLFNNTITTDVTDNNFNSIVKNTRNYGNHNNYNFNDVIIKDLKLYGGPFEIVINVVNSTDPIYLPTSSSYNDYIAMSIPKGFDMIVKFSDNNSTYAQFDIMKKAEKNSFQSIKVSGYNNDYNDSSNSTVQILFHNVKTDNQAVKYISTLMKSPEIKIKSEDNGKDTKEPADEGTRALGFRKNSPDSTPIEIQKGSGDIKINVDHVDDYNQPYQNGTKTQFITFLKNDIQITEDDKGIIPQNGEQFLFTTLVTKKPGDISEYAKEHGIGVPWRDVISSTPSIMISLTLLGVLVIVIALNWSKITKLSRVK